MEGPNEGREYSEDQIVRILKEGEAGIKIGKPVDNCYVEGINGRFRDDFLNENWFITLDHVEIWRVDYNQSRPHSSLGDLSPAEFKQQELEKIACRL